jgi:glycerophosphoryl diester phosphodiesterase
VHASADGVVVVIHDETLERTTDGTGLVRALPLAALQRLDAGHRFRAPDGSYPFRDRGIRIPTLAELLEAVPDVPLNIEIKQQSPPIEAAVLATLDRFGARARTLLAAEEAEIMVRIRTVAPDVVTSFSAHEVADFVQRVRGDGFAGYRPPGIALQVPPAFRDIPIITAASVAAAHELGLEVHAWTINDPAEIATLLALGVDGIMTDVPGVAARILRAGR